MADYCTEVELEARLGVVGGYFTGTSTPTTTTVGTIITRSSRMVDAITRQAEDNFGADPSEEDVKTASIEIAVAIIEGFWDPDMRKTGDELHKIGKKWLGASNNKGGSISFRTTAQVGT